MGAPGYGSPMADAVATTERILLIDDSVSGLEDLREALSTYRITPARSAREGLQALREGPDLVVVSLELRDLRGARALEAFRERAPGTPVIAVSNSPTIVGAVEAIRRGASDYVGRPIRQRVLLEAAQRALTDVQTRRELAQARERMRDRYGFSQLLTRSPRMLRVFDQIRAVAPTDATVLIRGETGTGKELISRALHQRSRRKDNPFIGINCGAFTDSLLESELFGHEKGSFTGAIGKRSGVFEMADSGTLFLDELGETTLNVQVSLLRVLEEMAFRRVGGHDLVHVDVRVIAATNVHLEQAVEDKKFREDLYYRLNVFPIELPPLRERREDIPLLIRHFLDDASQEYELAPPRISSGAMRAILDYDWPGNVRQLRALCERWLISHSGQSLELEHLPQSMSGEQPTSSMAGVHVDETRTLAENSERVVAQVERALLHTLLKRHKGHLGQTAEAAGVTRRTLYSKMKLYGLQPEDYRSGPHPGRPRST